MTVTSQSVSSHRTLHAARISSLPQGRRMRQNTLPVIRVKSLSVQLVRAASDYRQDYRLALNNALSAGQPGVFPCRPRFSESGRTIALRMLSSPPQPCEGPSGS